MVHTKKRVILESRDGLKMEAGELKLADACDTIRLPLKQEPTGYVGYTTSYLSSTTFYPQYREYRRQRTQTVDLGDTVEEFHFFREV